MTKFEDVPEEVLTDPTMRTALGMDPIPGMNTPVDDNKQISLFDYMQSKNNSSSSSSTTTTAAPEVTVFKNLVHPEFGELRTVEIDGEPWFVGKDVCIIFNDTNHNRSLGRIDSEDKKILPLKDSLGRTQKATFINESGLYALLFAMQPQKANNDGVSDAYPIEVQTRIQKLHDFKHWVTSEVLPSIRKNGAYIRNQENMTPAEIVARGLIAAQGKDVATALGYCNINKAVAAHVDEDDKKVLDFKGFSQNRKSSGLWVGHDFSSKTIINGKDVAAALGYTNSRDAIATHVFADDKGVESIDTLGGRQKMTIINESGLYALVFGSRLKIAKEFKHWVTSEVLPSIRKNGAYIRNQENMTPAEIVARGLIAAQKIIEEREQDHSTQPLSAVTCSY